MISDEQRTQLGQRTYLMDLADKNASLTPSDLNKLLRLFGIYEYTEDQLMAIAYPPQPKVEQPVIAKQPSELNAAEIVNSITSIQSTLHSTDTTRAVISANAPVEEKPVTPKRPRPTKADLQAELFTELVFGGNTYNAEQMAEKLARLMQLSNVKADPVTPAQMSLLYDYYGAVNSNSDSIRLGFEPLLAYLCDTLVYDERLADILPDSIHSQAASIHAQIQDGLGQLRKENYSLLVVLSSLPKESPQTYAFVDTLTALADACMEHNHYYVGESVMYAEMPETFTLLAGMQ